MNTDVFLDSMLGIKKGRANRLVQPRPRVVSGISTGAAVHGSLLAIVTLRSAKDTVRISRERSGFFVLQTRDQADLVTIAKKLSVSLSSWQVRRLVLRASPQASSHRADPASYKIEATLQLIKGLSIDLANAGSISNWAKKVSADLPSAIVAGSKLINCQRHAIEAAVYGLRGDQHGAKGGLDVH